LSFIRETLERLVSTPDLPPSDVRPLDLETMLLLAERTAAVLERHAAHNDVDTPRAKRLKMAAGRCRDNAEDFRAEIADQSVRHAARKAERRAIAWGKMLVVAHMERFSRFRSAVEDVANDLGIPEATRAVIRERLAVQRSA
jgi:hypothetical protein